MPLKPEGSDLCNSFRPFAWLKTPRGLVCSRALVLMACECAAIGYSNLPYSSRPELSPRRRTLEPRYFRRVR